MATMWLTSVFSSSTELIPQSAGRSSKTRSDNVVRKLASPCKWRPRLRIPLSIVLTCAEDFHAFYSLSSMIAPGMTHGMRSRKTAVSKIHRIAFPLRNLSRIASAGSRNDQTNRDVCDQMCKERRCAGQELDPLHTAHYCGNPSYGGTIRVNSPWSSFHRI